MCVFFYVPIYTQSLRASRADYAYFIPNHKKKHFFLWFVFIYIKKRFVCGRASLAKSKHYNMEKPASTLEEIVLNEAATIITALPNISNSPSKAILSTSSELSCQIGQVQVELSWSFAQEQKPVDLDIRFEMLS